MSKPPHIEEHPGFTLARIAGPPYERGLQHGQLLRDGVQGLRESFYRDVVNFRGRAWGLAFQAVISPMLLAMHRHIPPELRQEMRGVADGARISYRDVLIFNCFDDLLHSLWRIPAAAASLPFIGHRFACSSFALLGRQTVNGHLLHGRNLDYEVLGCVAADGAVTRALKENLAVIECRPDRGNAFLSVGWPGVVGVVTSISEAGLSLACLTSTVRGETPNGIPLPLLYRRITQYASNLEEAEQGIRRAKLTIGNNLLLASAGEDDARVFELSPRFVAARKPINGVLATTNHFMHEAMVPRQNGWVFPSSVERYTRLDNLCGAGTCTPEKAAEFLRDTYSLAADGNLWSCLENPGTIYSSVAEPSIGRIWLRANDQPGREFVQLTASWAGQRVSRQEAVGWVS